jgi:NADH:ubiquinone oxidoreductase subunit 2 (subunit N)
LYLFTCIIYNLQHLLYKIYFLQYIIIYKIYFPINIFLIKFLLIRILIIISSRNWLILWVRFELNTLLFLPFLKNYYYLYFTEAIIKYFLIQRICSILLIIRWFVFSRRIIFMILLAVKIGLPPFHWWVIDFLKINNWMVFFYLITIQKIGLFVLFSYFTNEKIIIMFIIIFSIIISIFSIFFLNNLINILLFSSIIHSSWLLSRLFFSIKLWRLYFLFYSIIILILIVFLKKNNVFYFSQSFYRIKWRIFWILMGLPPFSIFIIKWRISIFIIKWRISIFIMFIIISFIRLYIYFKFIYLNFLVKSSIININVYLNSFYTLLLLEVLILYIFIIL